MLRISKIKKFFFVLFQITVPRFEMTGDLTFLEFCPRKKAKSRFLKIWRVFESLDIGSLSKESVIFQWKRPLKRVSYSVP